MSEKKLFLLDGHALIYRAHYAFITRPLVNSKGMNVSASTGFTRTLWEIIKNQKPSHIAVSFDLSSPTFRHEMFKEYKAHREAQPEDITLNFPFIKRIIEGFNIPIITKEGFEADDIIGTLAKQAEKEGFTVYMVTPDKDYAQLVSDKIFMYKPGRKGGEVEILGKKEVLEKWQIKRVDQVIDILGLQGDSADNIPGIPGIGAKTAVKLLAKFDTLEGLIENAHLLKGKQKEKVETFAAQGLLSKKLATIDLNAPVQFNADDYKLKDINREKIAEVFKELEFRTLAKTILGDESVKPDNITSTKTKAGVQQSLFANDVATVATKISPLPAHSVAEKNITNTPHKYTLSNSPEKHTALMEHLMKQKRVCFDTETTGVDANQAELVGIAFAFKKGEAFYVPFPTDKEKAKELLEKFRPFFESTEIEKIGQNIKYDILMLKWYGIEVKGALFDTMIAHYLLEPELRHNMDYLAETYLKYQAVSITSLIGKKGKKQLSMRDIPVEKVTEYAAEDADITLQLQEYFEPQLKEENLIKLYKEIEEPLINTIVEVEYNGFNIDVDFLNKYAVKLAEEIKEKQNAVFEEAGVKFNLSSPKQVGQVLFEKLKIPYRWRKTASGQYSTSEEKLTELSHNHSIIKGILRYRALSKLLSTYVVALPKMVNPRTGRIHSSFNQALAATGRLSSKDPNLQNIPIRTPEGAEVRKAFIPRDENYILLAADYSQIELRLIAEMSGDEAMLDAFQKGQDIHAATAAKVFGVPIEEVTREQRYRAKTVNFSVIYGAGATNLSRQLEIKRNEASELIANYFQQYNGLKKYMDQRVKEARENGFVKTLMGRRRYLRDINSRNALIRSNAERMAINTPIQGSAADMIKIAMINIFEAMKEQNLKSKMILQVHDELVFDAHKDELDILKPLIEEKMKTAIPNLKVPILVSIGEGQNWLEAH